METQLLTEAEFEARKVELKTKTFPLLTHGHVKLIDAMGGDFRIADAARTTSATENKTAKDDVNLIRYLVRHAHTTPREFPQLTIELAMPMDLNRQYIRHRHQSVNEFSSRYTEVPDLNDETPPDKWRMQSTQNRQGSAGALEEVWPEGYTIQPLLDDGEPTWAGVVGAGHARWGVFCGSFGIAESPEAPELMLDFTGLRAELTPGRYLSLREKEFHGEQRGLYQERLAFGVAKEQARKDLCLSSYTRLWAHWDLHNLFHFLGLRMDSHAQWEIRQYADTIGNEIVAKLWPVAWAAFLDYKLNAISLTALDQVAIANILRYSQGRTTAMYPVPFSPLREEQFLEVQPDDWVGLTRCRERDEFVVKAKRLGLMQS